MKFFKKVKYAVAVVLAVGLSAFSVPAFADIDTNAVVEKINAISTSTDAVGGAFVSVAVGMIVFGFIIGMIFRKGR